MKQQKLAEVAVIDFEKFSIAQLPELNGKKEEIKAIIEGNPIVEITDSTSYELAKKSRTAVRSLRTSLESEQKTVKKKIKEHVLDVVDAEYDTLVLDVKSAEQFRQEPITTWEAKKEEERLERVRLEELRVKNIKDAIQTFKDAWIDTISHMIFEGVSGAKIHFEKTVSEFDRVKLAEFEVLFDDAVAYLDTLMNSKIEQLQTVENIRLEQIKLAEEREKQRIEAEKLAELQRIEREKFEAEQKLALENQRIAQEKFLKEKREFEEKQLEAKFQERCKSLTDLGFDLTVFELEHKYNPRWMNLLNSAKILNDFDWKAELDWVKEMIEIRNKPADIEVKFEEIDALIGEENADEAILKGLSTRLKANTPAVEKELTWDDIMNEYTENCLIGEPIFLSFLKDNFNVPTRKI